MTFKKWAWDIFETTGNLEAYLAIKEAETQEKIKETQIDGDLDGVNKD